MPLAGVAALGALAFGHIQFGVTASLAIGSVPGVFVGSLLSSTAPDRYVRPVITFVIAASGLKYVGVGATALGWILCAILLGSSALWLAAKSPGAKGAQQSILPRARPTRLPRARPTRWRSRSASGPPARGAPPQRLTAIRALALKARRARCR